MLYWRGKPKSYKGQNIIKGLIDKKSVVHIFTRNDSKNVNFKYEGIGTVEKIKDTTPITVYWKFEKIN